MIDVNKYGNINNYLNSNDNFNIPNDTVYFPGDSERCVEIPFVFSKIGGERTILDIGVSLSDAVYFYGLLLLSESGVDLHALDIVPIEKVMSRFTEFDQNPIRKIKFSVGDIRECSLEPDSFDIVLCVSVLEHIGFDKYIEAQDTVFDRPFENYKSFPDFYAWKEDHKAINQMMKLVKPGGRILLTVPFGVGGVFSSKDSKRRYATHLEYNLKKWEDLKSSIEYGVIIEERCFKVFPATGWREVPIDTQFDEFHLSEKYMDEGVLCVEIRRK